MKLVLIFVLIASIVMAAFGSPFTAWDSSSESESDNISSNATHTSNEIRHELCKKNQEGGVGNGGQGQRIDCRRYQQV